MYLAPLNYDRFFKKVFSDKKIAKRFLEDFFDIQIDTIELLKERHKLTDNAQTIEFDFRCKIDDRYVVIDMQQWYKADVVKRFYMYHAVNTAIQLENLPIKSVLSDEFIVEKHDGIEEVKLVVKNVRDYEGLEPVVTLIWLVSDTFNFEESHYMTYTMAPEISLNFIENDEFWKSKEVQELQRQKMLKIINNKHKDLNFLRENRLIYIFQRNIVKHKKLGKYVRWFEFAEKTRNKENVEAEFVSYKNDEIFEEMMRRLRRDDLNEDDLEYMKNYEEAVARFKRFEDGVKRDAKREARLDIEDENEKIYEEGMEKGMEIKEAEHYKEKVKMVIEMINEGMTDNSIAKITKFDILEVQKIRNEIYKN